MIRSVTPPKPFVKWVGGKRQLLSDIIPRIPSEVGHYFEPFIGGGAVFWALKGRGGVDKYTINDFNLELSNLYEMVRDNPEELIESLKGHENTEKYFYAIRALDREASFESLSALERASRFVYLNKTGFNGLYRVNAKGQHNVPYGRYKNPNIVDEPNIKSCSKALEGVSILTGDFEAIKPGLTKDSFVYLDPPYVPLSATSSFTGYTKDGFCVEEQLRLKEFCDYISDTGGKFLLSNSSAELVKDLYKGYLIEEVHASRAINSRGSGRGKVVELLISNY